MSSPGSIGDVFNSLLMNIVENPITSLTKANYVGILAWAVVIGIACRHAKESTKDMLVDISNGLSKVVTWIINFAPFGIMGLVYNTVSVNGLSTFTEYGKLLAVLFRLYAVYLLCHQPDPGILVHPVRTPIIR